MRYGQYSIELDRTGFPLVRKQGWGFAISLFPVSKYQFEIFMVCHGPKGNWYTDGWYSGILNQNPRTSWRIRSKNNKCWRLFVTSINHEEIKPFLRFLGKPFRLPKVEEWRKLLLCSKEIQAIPWFQVLKDLDDNVAPPVRVWIQHGLYPLAEEGLLELLEDTDGCIGRPLQELLPNTWTPETIKQVNWEVAKHVVGFRVVREE